ncbi:hypothetical protein Tco_0026101 [Tanacetum coccineum]
MATESNVPQLVDKKGAEGAIKPEIQWTSDERRAVVQDQRLKNIIMSYLPDEIIESAISCEIVKDTRTDLVYSFEVVSEQGRFEAMTIETEKNAASKSLVIDENRGQDDLRHQPKKRGTSKEVMASLDQRVAGVETFMAELKNQVEGLESLDSDFTRYFLYQPLFDEYFNPPPSVVTLVLAAAAPRPADPTGTPSSTIIDQDAPSPNNNPFVGVLIPEPNSKESSSSDVIPTNVKIRRTGTINMGLWYSKDSCIALTAFADADHAGYQDPEKVHLEMLCSKALDEFTTDRLWPLIQQNTSNRIAAGRYLTKAFGRERLEFLINKLRMRSMSRQTLKKLAEEEEE